MRVFYEIKIKFNCTGYMDYELPAQESFICEIDPMLNVVTRLEIKDGTV